MSGSYLPVVHNPFLFTAQHEVEGIGGLSPYFSKNCLTQTIFNKNGKRKAQGAYLLDTRRVVTAAAQCDNIKIQNWWIIDPDLYFLHGKTGIKNY